MSIERILALAIFVLACIVLARLAPAAITAWRIYAGTGRRRQEDAAGRAPAMPDGVADRLALIGDLGYRHLGETRLVLPNGEHFAWIAAADDGDSYAILTSGHVALTGLYSAWPDGTWLGTLHPLGQATDRPGLEVRIVPTTLAAAVDAHRAGLARLRAVHGAPRPVRTMPDMLALDEDYRVRFRGSRLLPITMRIVLPAVAAAIVAVLALALLVLAPS